MPHLTSDAVLTSAAVAPALQSLHSPRYDFNDDVIATGVRYWVEVVETALAAAG